MWDAVASCIMNTSKLRILAGAAIFVAGCAGHDDQDVTATTTAAVDPSATTAQSTHVSPTTSTEAGSVYVVVEAPRGDCADATGLACSGGYWVREVNRAGSARLVSSLDVSALAPRAIAQAGGAGNGELVLRGTFEPVAPQAVGETFTVLEAWRGMPGAEPSRDDRYLAVQTADAGLVASALNDDWGSAVTGVSVSSLAPPPIDAAWLVASVVARGALVAGRLDGGELDADQVFVQLPTAEGRCPMVRRLCGGGEVVTYALEDNLCLMATGCAVPGACPEFMPVCASGYERVSWPSQPAACPAYTCEPAFLSE
jgi:hypothetical protein